MKKNKVSWLKQLIWRAIGRDYDACSLCKYHNCISNNGACKYCYRYSEFLWNKANEEKNKK